jgi:hypothetical protein
LGLWSCTTTPSRDEHFFGRVGNWNEFRVLGLLGRCSTTVWATPPSPCIFKYICWILTSSRSFVQSQAPLAHNCNPSYLGPHLNQQLGALACFCHPKLHGSWDLGKCRIPGSAGGLGEGFCTLTDFQWKRAGRGGACLSSQLQNGRIVVQASLGKMWDPVS